jgi:hypothetical protein
MAVDGVDELSMLCGIQLKPNHSFPCYRHLSRFERVESIVKAREIVVSLAGALLDPPADQMDVCMQALAKCDRQTVANTFSKFQFRSACLRRELEAPATI